MENLIPPYVHDPGNQQNLWQVSERLTDASQKGPNYDPTGSVAMHNKREIPEEILRPEDRQVEKESGVVSDK